MKIRRFLAFSDLHIPHHHRIAVDVMLRAAERLRPDVVVCLGDLLDCTPWSSYPPTPRLPTTEYADDLRAAQAILDRVQRTCDRLVMLEGNHEYRLDRWAAVSTEGRGAYSMLAPRIVLGRQQHRVYIPYGAADGRYPHYRLSPRVIAVHGWTHARNAARIHLTMAQGRSIIYGHTHRTDITMVQDIWHPCNVLQARGAGCLCRPVPVYGTGRPVEWVNAFIVGYLGRRSETLYTVPILGDRCILPDGSEVRAQEE